MRKLLVAGNWKMYGTSSSIYGLIQGLRKILRYNIDIAVFPPYVYLTQVIKGLHYTSIQVGAQNSSHEAVEGAFTGEISPTQLADIGCTMVLVGHSERRILFCEDNKLIKKKFIAIKSSGLSPILCIGENALERTKGKTLEVIRNQLTPILDLDIHYSFFHSTIIAYEPIWAIGTGNSANIDTVKEVHSFIRQELSKKHYKIANTVRIIYGGSVNKGNANKFLTTPEIDGLLIGNASLNIDQFSNICTLASGPDTKC